MERERERKRGDAEQTCVCVPRCRGVCIHIFDWGPFLAYACMFVCLCECVCKKVSKRDLKGKSGKTHKSS